MTFSERTNIAVGYLPMDCPMCGRHRLMPYIWTDNASAWVVTIRCEKCEHTWGEERFAK